MTAFRHRIAIRADAAHWIGFGHIARCATLAERLRMSGSEVTFLCRDLPGHYNDWLEQQGYTVQRLPAPDTMADGWLGVPLAQEIDESLTALSQLGGVDWLLVDHYGLEQAWEQTARRHARRILVIDDLADRPHDCDLLLDQNLQAADQRYADLLPPTCRTLLGPRFALLRPEFANLRQTKPARDGHLRRLLIFMGGNDTAQVTQKALQGLISLNRPDLAVDVVIGSGNPHRDEISALCARLPQTQLHVQTPAMARLMASADLMLGAAGTTSWERCCLGLPALVVSAAPNQRDNGLLTARQRVACYLGDADALDAADFAEMLSRLEGRPGLLRRMSARARALVDGQGARRVALAMAVDPLQIRPATAADCDRMWMWRNDLRTRRSAFNTAAIDLAAHRQWFAQTLANPARPLLLGWAGDDPVGVLRYDRQEDGWEVSTYLDPELHGLGLGPRLIAAGSHWLNGNVDAAATIIARIRPENVASRQAFEKAGFIAESSTQLRYWPAMAKHST